MITALSQTYQMAQFFKTNVALGLAPALAQGSLAVVVCQNVNDTVYVGYDEIRG